MLFTVSLKPLYRLGIGNWIHVNSTAWARLAERTQHLVTSIQSLLARFPASPPQSRGLQACPPSTNPKDSLPVASSLPTTGLPSTAGLLAAVLPSLRTPSLLTSLSETSAQLIYSSTAPPTKSRKTRSAQRLLSLGAKWWDSVSRYLFGTRVSVHDPRAITDLEEGRAPFLTMRERRWVKVGWLSEPQGGLWGR